LLEVLENALRLNEGIRVTRDLAEQDYEKTMAFPYFLLRSHWKVRSGGGKASSATDLEAQMLDDNA
jgi:hypothetical protein